MSVARGLSPRHHIDKSIAPAKKEGGFKVERETKIKFIGSREEFVGQMERLGAELVQKTRMIDDLRFKASENFLPNSQIKLNLDIFIGPIDEIDEKQVIASLELLGFGVRKAGKTYELTCPQDMQNKTIRIRNDGGVWIFTTKRRVEKLDENGYIEEKPEVEVELKDPSSLQAFLENDLGLVLDSHRQKLRTSFRLKPGQLVELNESPAFESHNVPFWLEIEGRDFSDIEAAARQLGFARNHFFKGSDKEYLMKNGDLTEAETKILLY